MSNPKFVYGDGLYTYKWDRDVIFTSPSVAIGFTLTSGLVYPNSHIRATLHRVGPVDEVKEWFATLMRVFKLTGSRELMDGTGVLYSSRWNLEELNKLVSTTGYIGVFLEKMGVDIATDAI
jgi:hypothetical protein